MGCGPSGPLRVTTIQTGKSLNSDKSVGNHTTRFKPDDTMFASVLTDGPGAGTIGVALALCGTAGERRNQERQLSGSRRDGVSHSELERIS